MGEAMATWRCPLAALTGRRAMEIHRRPLRRAMQESPPPPPPRCDGGREDHGHGEGLGRVLVWQGTRPRRRRRGHARQPRVRHRGQPHRRRAPACCRGRPPVVATCRRRRPLRRALVPAHRSVTLKTKTSAFWRPGSAIEGRLVARALMAEADGADGRQPWVPLGGCSILGDSCSWWHLVSINGCFFDFCLVLFCFFCFI